MQCPLCGEIFDNADHALFNCEETKIETQLKTIYQSDAKRTKEAIARALYSEEAKQTHKANLTIILLRERHACYWASRLQNRSMKEEYQAKIDLVMNLLQNI